MIKRYFFYLIISLFILTFSYSQTPKRTVVITIDDLPFVDNNASINDVVTYTTRLLESLSKHHVTALGFVNESKLYQAEQQLNNEKVNVLEMWLNADMELGNHSYSHYDLNNTSAEIFQKDIIRGEDITSTLNQKYGKSLKYFRFPFNHTGMQKERKDSLIIFLETDNYVNTPFTIEHSDYIFSDAYSKAKLKNDSELMKKIKSSYLDFIDTIFNYYEKVSIEYLGYEPPQIFLIHASELNSICMDDMLARIELRGYKFVNILDALSDKAYQIKDEYVGKYGISWLHRWTIALEKKMNRKGEADPPQYIMDIYENK